MNMILTATTKIGAITEISRPLSGTKNGAAALHPGDTLEATVMKALPGNRYLLNINDSSLLADSQLQLTAGEKITVKVEKLTPDILLRVTSSTNDEAAVTNKYLLLHRSNPAALGEIFSKLDEILSNSKSLPPSLKLISANLEKIALLAEKILITGVNRSYVNNLTDFVKDLGLTMEHDLLKHVVQGAKISKDDNQTSVKRLFMDILQNVNAFMDNAPDIDDALLNQLKQLRHFAEESIAAIETNQVLNILSRESEGPYILQLPFAFPEGVRLQNIYIERENEQEKQDESKAASFRMAIFLDLDQMGEITVDARFHGKNIDCVFHCQNEEISHFLGNYLDELKGKLEGAGYDIGGLQCLVEENIRFMRLEYLSRQRLNNRLALNLFA